MLLMISGVSVSGNNDNMPIVGQISYKSSTQSMLPPNANNTFSSQSSQCCYSNGGLYCSSGTCCGSGLCYSYNYQCCTYGCADYYTTTCTDPPSDSSLSAGAIVGIVAAVLVTLVTIVAVVLIIRQNKRRRMEWQQSRSNYQTKLASGAVGVDSCPPHDMQLVGKWTQKDTLRCIFCFPCSLCLCAPGSSRKSCTKCSHTSDDTSSSASASSAAPDKFAAAVPGAPPVLGGAAAEMTSPMGLPPSYLEQQAQQMPIASAPAAAEAQSAEMPARFGRLAPPIPPRQQIGPGGPARFAPVASGGQYVQSPVAPVAEEHADPVPIKEIDMYYT